MFNGSSERKKGSSDDTDQQHPLGVLMKSIHVGVFDDAVEGRKPRAYTRWYGPEWEGCCEHVVEAENGTAAKKVAIQQHIDVCRKKSAG